MQDQRDNGRQKSPYLPPTLKRREKIEQVLANGVTTTAGAPF